MERTLPAGFLEAYRPRTHALFLSTLFLGWTTALLTAALAVGMETASAMQSGLLSTTLFGAAAILRWHLVSSGPAAAYRSPPQPARLMSRHQGRATVVVSTGDTPRIVGARDWAFGALGDAKVWVCIDKKGDGIIVPSPSEDE